MIFDFIVLGIGVLSRRIKDCNMIDEGNKILKERKTKSIWQQAKENNSMVTINNNTYMFLTPHEIYINEKYWDSGLNLNDFLIKFYKDNRMAFFKEPVRLIDKSGKEHRISSLYVSDIYYKYKKNKKIK